MAKRIEWFFVTILNAGKIILKVSKNLLYIRSAFSQAIGLFSKDESSAVGDVIREMEIRLKFRSRRNSV